MASVATVVTAFENPHEFLASYIVTRSCAGPCNHSAPNISTPKNCLWMNKTPEKIKGQLEFWFLNYCPKDRRELNGSEAFTLFDVLDTTEIDILEHHLNLRDTELPVLILRVAKRQVIINSTERFLRLNHSECEAIEYTDFGCHLGYVSDPGSRLSDEQPVSIKKAGQIAPFAIKKLNGEIVTWNIPTGPAGFGFWNVTKKCALIGRKYLNKTDY